jgi:cellulose biosynthesis protein BcsQ
VLTPGLYGLATDLLAQLYDYVIVDAPSAEFYHPLFTEYALPRADYLLVPITQNIAGLMNTDSWLNSVGRAAPGRALQDWARPKPDER